MLSSTSTDVVGDNGAGDGGDAVSTGSFDIGAVIGANVSSSDDDEDGGDTGGASFTVVWGLEGVGFNR